MLSGVTDHKAIGDGTTTYTHPRVDEVVAKRIAGCIADCRKIFIVCHPRQRLEPDRRLRLFEGWADDDINDAVRSNLSLIAHSRFWKNLKPYTQCFPDAQRLEIVLEDFANNPDADRKWCFNFVGVNTGIVLRKSGIKRNQLRHF